jgi:hypothetical protein
MTFAACAGLIHGWYYTSLNGPCVRCHSYPRLCSDVSSELKGGCDALQATFSTGLQGVQGAR